MTVVSVKATSDSIDVSKFELYRLIEEGFQAMQEGRVSTIEEVEERLNAVRAERG